MPGAYEGLQVANLSDRWVAREVSAYLESEGASVTRGNQLASGESLRDLLAGADVVLTDAGAADRPEFASIGGSAIVVVITPFGMDGPWSAYQVDEGSVLAASGLSSLTGPLGGLPSVLHEGTGPAGAITTLGVVAALEERQRTGGGGRIEVSELESSLQGLWTAALDYTVNGREQVALGARDMQAAPCGVYRCKDGKWIAIACFNEDEWFSLKVALGRPDWCELERMQTAASRLNEQREIDHHIGHWVNEQTRRPDESPTLVITMLDNLEVPRYTSDELARYFHGHGVPAAVVKQPNA